MAARGRSDLRYLGDVGHVFSLPVALLHMANCVAQWFGGFWHVGGALYTCLGVSEVSAECGGACGSLLECWAVFRRPDYHRGPPVHALVHWDNGQELRRSFQQSRRYGPCRWSGPSFGWPAAAMADGRRSATWIGEASVLAGALWRSPSFGILSTVT